MRLTPGTSLLMQYHLLLPRSQGEGIFLRYALQLSDSLVNYLLAESPHPTVLEQLLQGASPAPPPLLRFWQPLGTPPVTRQGGTPVTPESGLAQTGLVLPAALMQHLQTLCDRIQLQSQVDRVWGFQGDVPQGVMVVLSGAAGTGKTTAVRAIAQTLQLPIAIVDLAQVALADQEKLLQEILHQSPVLLLIKSAQFWLGRTPLVSAAQFQHFWCQRQLQSGLTFLSVRYIQMVKWQWRQQVYQTLEFPIPDLAARLQLWQQAIPTPTPLDPNIDWRVLAEQWPISGGEIRAIARSAAFYAAAESPHTKLGMQHLLQAGAQAQHPPRKSTPRRSTCG